MPIVSAASSGSMRPLGFTYGAKPVWVDATLADFRYLDSYSDSVQASGTAPIQYSVVSGALPSGLTLNQNTGAITGSTTATGTYNFTLQARNHLGTITQAFTNSVPAAPVPPSFVNQGSLLTTSSSISITMPTRQAGDIAVVSFSAWKIPGPINSQGANATGWTIISNDYFGASILDNNGNVSFDTIQYGLVQNYYRVMTNTSADNFSYTLPQSMTYIVQYLIVRPASGMTFSASGGYQPGQTLNLVGNPTIPPSNNYFKLTSLVTNSYPKTVVATNHSLGQTVNSGPSYAVGTGGGTSTASGRWRSSISNTTAMTKTQHANYYSSAYITGFTDSSVDGAYVGTFSYAGEPNYWHFNSSTVLTWTRT